MLRVDPSLFSNVITAVQRTGSLTGGSVRGLPNGVVIEGLKGINSFGSDVSEAQKEFQLGRVRSSLERIKQIESLFNGIAGRWNASVGSVISSARHGRQQLSIQKLNEVKSAQTKMQQLTGPASKAFQDLVSALEHAVAMEGRTQAEERQAEEQKQKLADEQAESQPESQEGETPSGDGEHDEDTPDINLLGQFRDNYRFGAKLEIRKGKDNKARVVPALEKDKFYFVAGFDPPRVVRVRQIEPKSMLVFDPQLASEIPLDAKKIRALILSGIWALRSKN